VPKAEVAPIEDGYLDKNEAAAFLRISLRTLGYRMKEPGFPIHRHNGRRPLFKKSELEAWASKGDKSGRVP
jgi:predicted DNA-binding transcriptional regulator AlpA